MKAILDQEAIKIAHCAAKLDDGSILQCVRIGEREIAACDGVMLARRPIPTELEAGEVILIKAKDILKAESEWGAKSLIIETSTDLTTATITDGGNNSIDVELAQGDYPNIDNLIPTTKSKAYVALNKNLLAKIAEIAEGDTVMLKVRESIDPVEFEVGETRGVVMPIYRGWEE